MSTVSEVPKIKGLAFMEALKWYSHAHGQSGLVDAVAELPPRLRVLITRPELPSLGLLPGSWYPSELIQIIFAALCRGHSPAQTQQLAANFARASIANTLSGFYGNLMRMLVSPELIAAHYQKIWRLYQSTGDCVVIVHSPTQHELRISDWGGHTPFFCQMAMHASQDVLEVVGCKNVRAASLQCVARGAPHCAYSLSWMR